MVRLKVRHAIGGQSFELENVDTSLSIAELKRIVYQHCKVPPSCQKLLVESTILDDSETLASHCPAECVFLSVSVVCVVDGVLKDLESDVSSKATKRRALEALQSLRRRGDDCVIAAVCDFLEGMGADTVSDKMCGLRALNAVAERGNERAVVLLCAHLEASDWLVRRAAVVALGEVARNADEQVILVLCARLKDSNPDVRCVAVEALSAIADTGNKSVIAALCTCSDDCDWCVRLTTVEAFRTIAGNDDERAMNAILACLGDDDARVRRAAAETLRCLKHSLRDS
mmetsp:Transcript_34438/g.94781  ORF Transcript_34438/g.94781 Transcript_34438/m.94781 type:complete len:286 (+) Transcript_34438:15-872(+)